MKTYKIIGKTNGYIANRDIHFNGKTEITLATSLSLEEALTKLDEFFTHDYDYPHDGLEISYNEETGESVYGFDDRWTEYHDGTASYEYDSRYYSIVEEEVEEVEEEKMFRLMNHDSSHNKPQFEAYTVAEHNEQFGTNYNSVEEAINADPEYLFTEQEMKEYLAN